MSRALNATNQGIINLNAPILRKGKEHQRFERKKALKASTWDDSSDSEDESKEEEIANLCLMANDDKVCSSSTNEVNNELEENFELLLEAFKNQGRKIKDLKKANKALEEENHFLKNEMSTLQEQVTFSIASQRELSNDLEEIREESLGSSLKLQKENNLLVTQVEDLTTTLTKFTTSTKHLDMLLSNQKCVFSKTGVGYEKKEKFYSNLFTQHDKIYTCKSCGRLYKGHHQCPLKRVFIINGKPTLKVWMIKGSKPPITNPSGPKVTWVPRFKG